MNRQKDVQYSSRAVTHIRRQKQIHRLRHIIAELSMRLPESERESNLAREMASYGCLTRMHVVRLLAPLEGEDHTKDIDFSRKGIRSRWEAGYGDARQVLADAPWEGRSIRSRAFTFTNAAQRPRRWDERRGMTGLRASARRSPCAIPFQSLLNEAHANLGLQRFD